ncbi:hypothetical protein HYPP_00930 [Hyphomicrobium sp. ghe19]|nr:hypothetical protein HYPP_00930 [Hyphomicrobium sp. ghe19]
MRYLSGVLELLLFRIIETRCHPTQRTLRASG